jgi:hypothetical protein
LNRIATLNRTRAPFLLSLDSDDEIMNRTAEIDLAAQKRVDADMVEHKAFEVDIHGRLSRRTWGTPKYREADNETLMNDFVNTSINWNLWLKLIRRSLYVHALAFLGDDVIGLKNEFGQDRLHMAAMYRFVRRYITVDYYGYIYYRNIPANSIRREKNTSGARYVIDVLVNKTIDKVITVGFQD